ncbi:MAG: signal peptidase I [Aquisalimonadaceae bacterium]
MFLDFEALLILVTLVTGVTVAWNYARRRSASGRSSPAAKENWWVELCRSLFPVILVVLIIRSFLVEPFRIPSGSMIPTLLPGDFILVSKFAYGIRLPMTNQRVLGDGAPARGDLVVFQYPENPAQDYIKRVIGLPGDRITFHNRRVLVNGEPLPLETVGEYDDADGRGADLFTERMGDLEYNVVHQRSFRHPDGDYRVPEGHYFMIGDNRDRSSDSRRWGPVAEKYLVGRAFLIWMSWDMQNKNVNWSRIGDRIQ